MHSVSLSFCRTAAVCREVRDCHYQTLAAIWQAEELE